MMITNADNAQLKRHYSKSGKKAISRGKIDTWECLSCAGVSDIPAVSGGEERVREETTPIHVKGIRIRVLQTEVLHKPHRNQVCFRSSIHNRSNAKNFFRIDFIALHLFPARSHPQPVAHTRQQLG